jgi:malonyl-CoA O-methyltransferase
MQAERGDDGQRGHQVDAVALRRAAARVSGAAQPPWLHAEAGRRMAERLPWVKLQPAVVLDCSGPAGGSTALLAQAYPQARQWALVAEAPTLTPRRWWQRRPTGPEPIVADALPDGAAELLWSNMALHGAVDPQPVFERWHRALAVGGFLMFSTLGPGSLTGLQQVYRQNGWGEPFAPFIDMHDLGDMLVQAGFADPVMDQEMLTLTWPDAKALLDELHALGANASPRRHPGLRTPRWRNRLGTALQAQAADGRPALSFELVYGHAFKAAPRARVQAETAVPLADMRALIRSSKR